MIRKRLVITVVFVAVMTVAIGAAGQLWITSSEPYELGRAAVAAQLDVPIDTVNLKRLAAFQFADATLTGKAGFVLCDTSSRCFTVVAKKENARWSVIDLVPR